MTPKNIVNFLLGLPVVNEVAKRFSSPHLPEKVVLNKQGDIPPSSGPYTATSTGPMVYRNNLKPGSE